MILKYGAYTEENIIANPTLGLSEGTIASLLAKTEAPQMTSGEIYGSTRLTSKEIKLSQNLRNSQWNGRQMHMLI